MQPLGQSNPSQPALDHSTPDDLREDESLLLGGLTPVQELDVLISLLDAGGIAMIGIFLVAVAGSVLPIQVAEPLWLIGIITTLLSHAGYALTGFVLIHLAAAFGPDRLQLQRRCQLASRLALPVALGFLLLIPLQGWSVWRGISLHRGVEARQQDEVQRNLARWRQEINAATSVEQLRTGLARLQAPPLTASDQALPLPQLQRQLLSQLQQVEAGFRQSRSSSAWSIGKQIPALLANLRVLLLSLLFAFAFAAGARRRGQPLPFLEEWLMRRQLARDQAVQRRQELREMKQQRLIEKLEQIEQDRQAPSPPTPAPQRAGQRKRRGRHGIVDADYFEAIFSEEENPGKAPEDQSEQQPPFT